VEALHVSGACPVLEMVSGTEAGHTSSGGFFGDTERFAGVGVLVGPAPTEGLGESDLVAVPFAG